MYGKLKLALGNFNQVENERTMDCVTEETLHFVTNVENQVDYDEGGEERPVKIIR